MYACTYLKNKLSEDTVETQGWNWEGRVGEGRFISFPMVPLYYFFIMCLYYCYKYIFRS